MLPDEIDKEAYIQEKINQLPGLSPAHALVHVPTEDFLDTGKHYYLFLFIWQ